MDDAERTARLAYLLDVLAALLDEMKAGVGTEEFHAGVVRQLRVDVAALLACGTDARETTRRPRLTA